MMSERKRIIVNTIATYGRSVLAVALGLFSTRWVLNGLGQSDFGLYGVVGGLIVFITYLNTSLSGSISRFFAYAIGECKTGKSIELLVRWFNIALCIHISVPLIMVCIGYPVGVYVLESCLRIPADRMAACLMVFRFSLVSAFTGMVSVPFVAMFQAHQNILEMSLLGCAHTLVNFILHASYFALAQITQTRADAVFTSII